ncbi:MAG TPA: FAD-dependent oxidoreductase, partial [Desulfurivibrionaceae bacterium]|nr:FAD-dependent oxidoreductase [Desulfurivibrionaceae bacterium]
FELVQGAHLVIKAPPIKGVYFLEARQDGRGVFVMPWRGRVLVGTTESRYDGEPGAVTPGPEEIAYLQQVLQDYFPAMPGQISAQFAGLRVLPAGGEGFRQRSREVVVHRAASCPRILSIYGGKLTNYRSTAEKVIGMLRPQLPARKRIAATADLKLQIN